MKKNLAIVLLSVCAATTSFAAKPATRLPAGLTKITVKCSVPKGFAGLSSELNGVLELSALPNGGAKATGKLAIKLNDPRNPWQGEKMVMGQYDDLTSAGSDRYFHGGATMKNSDDIMEIYVNYSRPDMSYVEYAGHNYKTSCQ